MSQPSASYLFLATIILAILGFCQGYYIGNLKTAIYGVGLGIITVFLSVAGFIPILGIFIYQSVAKSVLGQFTWLYLGGLVLAIINTIVAVISIACLVWFGILNR